MADITETMPELEEDLTLSMILQQEALIRVLVKKGYFSNEELIEEINRVCLDAELRLLSNKTSNA